MTFLWPFISCKITSTYCCLAITGEYYTKYLSQPMFRVMRVQMCHKKVYTIIIFYCIRSSRLRQIERGRSKELFKIDGGMKQPVAKSYGTLTATQQFHQLEGVQGQLGRKKGYRRCSMSWGCRVQEDERQIIEPSRTQQLPSVILVASVKGYLEVRAKGYFGPTFGSSINT